MLHNGCTIQKMKKRYHLIILWLRFVYVANFYTKFELPINKKFTETFRYQHITEIFQESPHPSGCVGHQC